MKIQAAAALSTIGLWLASPAADWQRDLGFVPGILETLAGCLLLAICARRLSRPVQLLIGLAATLLACFSLEGLFWLCIPDDPKNFVLRTIWGFQFAPLALAGSAALLMDWRRLSSRRIALNGASISATAIGVAVAIVVLSFGYELLSRTQPLMPVLWTALLLAPVAVCVAATLLFTATPHKSSEAREAALLAIGAAIVGAALIPMLYVLRAERYVPHYDLLSATLGGVSLTCASTIVAAALTFAARHKGALAR